MPSDPPLSAPVISDIPAPEERDDLTELRRLILEPEQVQIRQIREILEGLEVRPEDVGKVLAEAVMLRSEQDNKLTIALIPTVEETVRASIRKDPATFESILSPVIGQTIRHAIAQAFQAKLQNFNQTLVQSLSWQGLKWRMEALRTGKSFAEVVLLHSLLYRVEQVLLIHRETGLILQHMAADGLPSFQDADVVSGMLTAIQDFVRDSFNMDEEDALQTFQVGELTVWVVQGEMALLAAVIRGDPPEALRVTLQKALEEIHFEKGEALSDFNGDTAAFNAIRYCLRACFEAEYQGRKKGRLLPWLLFLLLLIAGGIGFYYGLSHIDWEREEAIRKPITRPVRTEEGPGSVRSGTDRSLLDLKERLHGLPGIMVTEVTRRGDTYRVSGLRDPLAPDPRSEPERWLEGADIPPEKVVFDWTPYQALHPDFVRQRAQRLLAPPPGVDLTYQDGVLTARGTASHDWVERFRILGPALSGVTAIDGNALTDRAVAGFRAAKKAIEERVVIFIFNTARVRPDQIPKLKALVADARKLRRFGRELEAPYLLEIVGHTDSTGTERRNETLSRERAAKARAFLISNGMDPDRLRIIGVADKAPVREEKTEADKAMNRSVTFRFIEDEPTPPEEDILVWP